MLGKAKNEFRRTTDEFKQTWEREVDFESDDKKIGEASATSMTTSIQKSDTVMKNEIVAPDIKEVSEADFQSNYSQKESATSSQPVVENPMSKRDWL